MQNLKSPKKRILINTLTAPNFGVYQDTATSTKAKLLIKKDGMTIDGQGTVGGTTLATGFKGSRSFTDVGKFQSVLLTFDPNCPCSECDYEYGIDIFRRVKTPNVHNPYLHKDMRPYGGSIASLQTCSSGKVAVADQLIMEDTIMDGITADTGIGTDPGAWFSASRCYTVTDDDTTTNSAITFTWSDDTTTAITGTANATGQLALVGNNTTTAMTTGLPLASAMAFNDVIRFYKISTASAVDTYLIVCMVPGLKYTIADTTTSSVPTRHMLIKSTDKDYQFDIVVKDSIATQKGLWLTDFVYVADTKQNMTVHKNGGTGTAVTGNATIATFLTNVNTATNTEGLEACTTYDVTRLRFYMYNEVAAGSLWNFSLSFTKNQTNWTTVTYYASTSTPKGKFPYMTSDDVHRIFSNQKHMGGYDNLIYGSLPSDGDQFAKYYISFYLGGQPGLHGASSEVGYRGEVEIYININYIGTANTAVDLWDATNYMWESTADGAFTADTNFEQLLDAWVGDEPADWVIK